MTTLFSFFVFLSFTSHVQGRSALYDLYQDLLDDYKPCIRPRRDHRATVFVSINFSMVSVEGIDHKTETLATTGYYSIEWRDDFLTWDPSKYDDVRKISLSLDRIWTPDICVINEADGIPLLSSHGGIAAVTFEGEVVWFAGAKQRTKCFLDVKKFPFDVQTCKIHLIQWVSASHEVNLTAGGADTDSSLYKTNGEWSVESFSKQTLVHTYESFNVSQSEVVFTISFRRKYLYYVVTVILPVMFLSVLNLGVYFLPAKSGEKASLSGSIVLAYAVFLTVLGDILPEVSDSVSIFGVYVLSMLFVKVATTLSAIAVVSVYHKCDVDGYKATVNKEVTAPFNALSNDGKAQCVVDQHTFAKLLNTICLITCAFLTTVVTFVCFILILN